MTSYSVKRTEDTGDITPSFAGHFKQYKMPSFPYYKIPYTFLDL
jgi:hypothetical protein